MKRMALAIAILGMSAAANAAEGESPKEILKGYIETIQGMVGQNRASARLSSDERAKVKEIVNSLLDYRELSRRSLDVHWDPRNDAERKNFVSILRRLIEKNYMSKLRSNASFTVKYLAEEVDGNRAAVKTMARGGKHRAEIEYRFIKRAKSGWIVYDLFVDDVSLVENYREQFDKIIREKSTEAEGFAHLTAKMKKKLDE
jgi:phospholipid transport system substrate-binding protein